MTKHYQYRQNICSQISCMIPQRWEGIGSSSVVGNVHDHLPLSGSCRLVCLLVLKKWQLTPCSKAYTALYRRDLKQPFFLQIRKPPSKLLCLTFTGGTKIQTQIISHTTNSIYVDTLFGVSCGNDVLKSALPSKHCFRTRVIRK